MASPMSPRAFVRLSAWEMCIRDSCLNCSCCGNGNHNCCCWNSPAPATQLSLAYLQWSLPCHWTKMCIRDRPPGRRRGACCPPVLCLQNGWHILCLYMACSHSHQGPGNNSHHIIQKTVSGHAYGNDIILISRNINPCLLYTSRCV